MREWGLSTLLVRTWASSSAVVMVGVFAFSFAYHAQHHLCADGDVLRTVAEMMSSALNPSTTPLLYLAAVAIFIVGSALGAWRRPVGVVLTGACVGGLLGAIAVTQLKEWIATQRPNILCAPTEAVGYGMPSGHAQTAGAVLGCGLILTWALRVQETMRRFIAGILTASALLLAAARVAVGAHSIAQVAVGFTLGFAMSLGTAYGASAAFGGSWHTKTSSVDSHRDI